MRTTGFVPFVVLAVLLAPCPSFATTINVVHIAVGGCSSAGFSFMPFSAVTTCNRFENTLGDTLTTTALLHSRVDFTSIGALLNYSVEIDAPSGFSVSPPSGIWADANSLVDEQLRVSGGSGGGVLRVGVDIHGTSTLNQFMAGSSVSASVFIDSTADGNFSGPGIFSLDIPFTFDAPFAFRRGFDLRLLGPGLGGHGHFGPFSASADFLNSADFTFAVLDQQLGPVSGSTIVSDSGFVYPQAVPNAPVPEPASLLLLGTGLIGAGVKRWRRMTIRE